MISTLATATLEKILNSYIRLDSETVSSLAQLSGKIILIEFPDWNFKFYLIPTNNGVQLLNYYEGQPDTTIKGSPLALTRLSRKKTFSNATFSNVEIIGDTELGQKIQNIFSHIDIDWEEQLSKLMGDVVAHQIGNFVRKTKKWTQQTISSLQQDVTEYLQEEARYLPPRLEIEDFFNDINTLRNDVERFEVRLQLLINTSSNI